MTRNKFTAVIAGQILIETYFVVITDESVSREYRCVLSLVDALGFCLKLVCGLDDGPVLGGHWIRVSL